MERVGGDDGGGTRLSRCGDEGRPPAVATSKSKSGFTATRRVGDASMSKRLSSSSNDGDVGETMENRGGLTPMAAKKSMMDSLSVSSLAFMVSLRGRELADEERKVNLVNHGGLRADFVLLLDEAVEGGREWRGLSWTRKAGEYAMRGEGGGRGGRGRVGGGIMTLQI